MYKKERKTFFNSLNPPVVSDNRKFWKTVKLLFSSKGSYGNKIKLVENEEIIDDDTKVAKELNNFFKTDFYPLKTQIFGCLQGVKDWNIDKKWVKLSNLREKFATLFKTNYIIWDNKLTCHFFSANSSQICYYG